jgi:hypothetical protein
MPDMTTEKELKALFVKYPPQPDHKVVLEKTISLHTHDFFQLYLADDAEFLMTKFFV